MKRKGLTRKLLIAFKNLCDKSFDQAAKQGYALGIKIVNEAGEISKDPGEIAAAFREMLDKGWIAEASPFEIWEFYKPEIQLYRELLDGWPLVSYWFRLTAQGKEVAERLSSSPIRKIWFTIKDNAKTIIITVIGVLLARLIIYLMKIFFAYTR